mgnify:FL=1
MATEYVVQGWYGEGWEDLTTHDNRDEAEQDLSAYFINEPQYAHKILKRSE